MNDPTDGRTSSAGLRRVRSPLALPSVRAVVGGLLVAAACVTVTVAHHAAGQRHVDRWLVARRSVPAGEVLTASDLALAPMDLPAISRRRAIADPTRAIGRIVLNGLRAGDPLLQSALVDGPVPPGHRRRVGVALDAASALGGTVRSGQRVDVVAIGGADRPTEVIAANAVVALVTNSGEGVGSDGRVRVVLDVADAEAARRIVDAASHDGVHLVGPSPAPDGAG